MGIVTAQIAGNSTVVEQLFSGKHHRKHRIIRPPALCEVNPSVNGWERVCNLEGISMARRHHMRFILSPIWVDKLNFDIIMYLIIFNTYPGNNVITYQNRADASNHIHCWQVERDQGDIVRDDFLQP